MRSVVLSSVVRTPIGRAVKGSLRAVRPEDLVAGVIARAVSDAGIDPALIDDHVLGTGYPEGRQGYNLARRAGLLAGLPVEIPGSTVSRFCASSMQATRVAAHAIMTGEARAYLVSGVESVSQVGRTLAEEHRHPDLTESGPLPDVYVPMGVTAENVAARFGISRADMDAFAVRSHQRAVAATRDGFYAREIDPVRTPDGVVYQDDGPRPDTSVERLAQLRPAFREDGVVTAGNSCPLNDGAVAAILVDEDFAEKHGLPVRARILASSVSGVDPSVMGVGPIDAIGELLARTGRKIDDIDVVELNEAFASQVLAVSRAVGIDIDEQLNPHGGALALGHPFGMTGLRLVGTLVNGLERRGGRLGIATLCVGGGQGMAMLVERV
ncbi:thiolase family protein [Dactylosporangium sp. CA-092794]|uniref:thiolase family protein n=1 Tax=Dactylosporangium sp. CA-092794 TaxID=3239929 RepID=UPI003D9216B0